MAEKDLDEFEKEFGFKLLPTSFKKPLSEITKEEYREHIEYLYNAIINDDSNEEDFKVEYNKGNYKGRRIRLFPNDTYMKKGIITNVDDLGFTILITEADERSGYRVGNTYFFNHATNLIFLFID